MLLVFTILIAGSLDQSNRLKRTLLKIFIREFFETCKTVVFI